eukprot:TRINITY_DN54220_c0_g1_i1.p1 TRINITY_DN54220_c0_g1~~TRINITY_DN54220_c0_g1_i1.p1  ORF type:complete len:483 (+),score=76.21 TRINITY_DN54220_c0_g1_i1:155-1603(+)
MAFHEILFRPVYIVVGILFKPLDLVLFKADAFTPRFKWLQRFTAYVLDVRLVLCDYFEYVPPQGQPWKGLKFCNLCTENAKFWCVECKKRLCPGCTARYHHPKMFSELHSLEEIQVDSTHGVRLFTPILAEVFLLIFIYYSFTHVTITPSYLHSFDMCPAIGVAREVLGRVDAKILYYFKDSLINYCGIEDSFYKLFWDAWVRDVVTTSDDTILLLTTLINAWIFETVLKMVVVPLPSALYALFLMFFSFVESKIPRNDFTSNLERMVNVLDGISLFEGRTDTPPLTLWRRRPSKDTFELILYAKNRATRFFSYYYDRTQADICYLVNKLMIYMVIFRLACIWSVNFFGANLGAALRSILLRCGLRETIYTHMQWFQGRAANAITDSVLFAGLKPVVLSAEGLFLKVVNSAVFYLCLGFLLLIALVGFVAYTVLERRRFAGDWSQKGLREQCVGVCGTSCSCAATSFFDQQGMPTKEVGKMD